MTTTFEDFSNEILIDILEYIVSPTDVYCAFSKLNQRFNTILRSVRLNLDIFLEDKQSLTLIRCFSTHCNRLRIHNVCPTISLEHFSHLRSLTINEPTDAQINSIHMRILPMLEYLTSPVSMMILDCLFGDYEHRWLFLRSCRFYFCPVPYSKSIWQSNRTLRTLSGVVCSRSVLSQLLSLLPCLQYLRVEMISNDLSQWNLTIFQKTLSSLRISFNQSNFYDDLCALIGPNLSRLHLELYHEQTSINFNLLGCLLESLTTKLQQFNCDCQGMEISLDAIKTAHILFHNIQSIKSQSCDIIRLICRDMV